jgi:hypothetical protein
VAPLEQVAVPAQNRVRAYQEREVTQFAHREMVEQAGEDSAVDIGERGLADLALQYEQLVPRVRISMSLSRSLIGRRRSRAKALVAARWARRSSTTDHNAVRARPGEDRGGQRSHQRSSIKAVTWADDLSAPALPELNLPFLGGYTASKLAL